MSWRRSLARRYTDPQIKAMGILQRNKIRFVSEEPFPLSRERGDGVVADIYLPESFTRVECDDPQFHGGKEEKAKDMRLKEIHGIRTVRLDNRRIMLASGENYVLEAIT